MCAWKVYSDRLCMSVCPSVWFDRGIHTQYVYSIFSDTNWVCSLQLPTHKRKHKHKRTLNESFTVNDKTGYYLLEPKKVVCLGIPFAMGTILCVYYYYCYSRHVRNTLLLLILDWLMSWGLYCTDQHMKYYMSTVMEPRKRHQCHGRRNPQRRGQCWALASDWGSFQPDTCRSFRVSCRWATVVGRCYVQEETNYQKK